MSCTPDSRLDLEKEKIYLREPLRQRVEAMVRKVSEAEITLAHLSEARQYARDDGIKAANGSERIATAADETHLAGHLRRLQANRDDGFGGHLHPGQ